MEANVQTAKLCVDAFFRNSSQNLTKGIREGTGDSLPWQVCARRDGDSSEEDEADS